MTAKIRVLRHLLDSGGSVFRHELDALGIPPGNLRNILSQFKETGAIERRVVLTKAGEAELAELERAAAARVRRPKKMPHSIDLLALPESLESMRLPKLTDAQIETIRQRAFDDRELMIGLE